MTYFSSNPLGIIKIFMKISKPSRNNIIFVVVLILLIIPQTRKPIQVLFHKMISYVNPVHLIDTKEQLELETYSMILIDENNNNYDFNEVNGKVVVINFWATWCPPCIAEMPSLQKLYESYSEDVVFIFATSDNLDLALKFKNDKSYSFPIYNFTEGFPQQFGVKSIPRTFILSKRGKIVIDKSGATNWFSESVQKEIEKLIKEVI